ncbi:MAG: hypothetical protein WDZ77_01330 [Candidatus Pacearchaeota archaeon]
MSAKKIEPKTKQKVFPKSKDSMKKELLKEAVSLSVGRQAQDIIDFIDDKKYVNEFLIAKKLEITINQTRNILYKLSDFGFVSSIRKKDKKKGWYTYFWKIESVKALEFLRNNLKKRIGQIINQVESREMKTFYVCNTCNIEFNEENALLYDFTCNECGNVFKIKDNTKLVRELKKNLDRQKEELSVIEEELGDERGKVEKMKEKVIKKEAKEKLEKRRAARKKSKLTKPIKVKDVKQKIAKPKNKIVKKISKKLAKKFVKKKPKVSKKKPNKKNPNKKSRPKRKR